MKILIIEDSDSKYGAISDSVAESLPSIHAKFSRAHDLSEATKLLYENRYDVVFIDLMLPHRRKDDPIDVTEDILGVIEASEKNSSSSFFAISGFEDLIQEQRARFIDAGIVLIHYSPDSDTWRTTISSCMARLRQSQSFDFVIFCALDKEREGFRSTDAKVGSYQNIRGLDCLHIEIGGLRGVCIKPPRMGLVEATIAASRAIELFNPRFAAMSGICAGFSGRAKLGALLVADPCWEHQTGKWSSDGFKREQYDVDLEGDVRTHLEQLIASNRHNWLDLKTDLIEDSLIFEKIEVAPMITGSSVIASSEKVEDLKEHHRKTAGIDMEMYGLYRAARISARKPVFFGAKTVVDLADEAKGDTYHNYGSVLSARFVVKAIEHLATHLPDQ